MIYEKDNDFVRSMIEGGSIGFNSYQGTFYSHSDHLGSAAWVTTGDWYNGTKLIQHMQYLPWGEVFADQRAMWYAERFTFSGKERDAETGYSYFGFRYYLSHYGIWGGVDPLSDKYPGISPYAYCGNNPIMKRDPDGREITDRAEELVNDLTSKAQSMMQSNSAKIALANTLNSIGGTIVNQGTISKLKNENIQLGEIISEIGALRTSTQVYDIVQYNLIGNNRGTISGAGNNVLIKLKNLKDMPALANELKHAYQFEMGEISFSSGGVENVLEDYGDEIAAFHRSYLFGDAQKSPGGAYKNLRTKTANLNLNTVPFSSFQKAVNAVPIEVKGNVHKVPWIKFRSNGVTHTVRGTKY